MPIITLTTDLGVLDSYLASVKGAIYSQLEDIQIVDISNNIGASSFLDVDVPPSVAVGDAALGNLIELLKCVKSCDVMKPTLEAAGELLAVAKSNGTSCDPDEVGIELDSTLGGVAEQLLNTFSSPKFEILS